MRRDQRLESREGRRRLKPAGEPYWRTLEPGLALGYRKGKRSGVWVVRRFEKSRYKLKRLAEADDFRDADGKRVLDWKQAYRAAIGHVDEHRAADVSGVSPDFTVADAMREYLEWFRAHGRGVYQVETTTNRHILPCFGTRRVAELTPAELRKWQAALLEPSRPSARGRKAPASDTRPAPAPRPRSKATANRILGILKAALNRAYQDGRVASADAWRRVKPFRKANDPRVRFLDRAECKRLLNACEGDFRSLVRGALVTGCRYGELRAMRSADYHSDAATITVAQSKSGRARHVPLTQEGVDLFERLTAGKRREDLVFTNAGEPWGKHDQVRRMREACDRAEINPPASFHLLRHTYASHLALAGVPLNVIAEALGHADTRMTGRHYAHLLPSYVADTVRKHLPTFGPKDRKVRRLGAA